MYAYRCIDAARFELFEQKLRKGTLVDLSILLHKNKACLKIQKNSAYLVGNLNDLVDSWKNGFFHKIYLHY